MTETFDVMVHVVKTSNTGQVASGSPEPLQKADVDKIAGIVNQIVINFHDSLLVHPEEHESKRLALSEVDLTFGIDFQAKTKIPIIWPLLAVGFNAGATFQVHVKLSRGIS